MSVEFDDQSTQKSVLYSRFERANQTPAMVAFIMRITGISQSGANAVMILIMLVCLGLAGYLIKSTYYSAKPVPARPAAVQKVPTVKP